MSIAMFDTVAMVSCDFICLIIQLNERIQAATLISWNNKTFQDSHL